MCKGFQHCLGKDLHMGRAQAMGVLCMEVGVVQCMEVVAVRCKEVVAEAGARCMEAEEGAKAVEVRARAAGEVASTVGVAEAAS